MIEESKTKKCAYPAETILVDAVADVLADCFGIILAARAVRLAVSVPRHSTGGDLRSYTNDWIPPAQVESGDDSTLG